MNERQRKDQELEGKADIRRTEYGYVSHEDYDKQRRKILGPLWGKPRRKMTGWPRGRT